MAPSSDTPEADNTCFSIFPLGEEGSATRESSRQVFNHIIAPAAKSCGLYPVSADQISSLGMITTQVINHLKNDAMVIADLSDHNPNVFYELALRHAFRKPVVQLIMDDQQIPFDVQGMRTVKYKLTLDGAAAAHEKMIQQIEKALDPEFDTVSPVTIAIPMEYHWKTEDSFICLGEKREAGQQFDMYFEKADKKLDVLGISVAGFFSGVVTTESLNVKIRNGCKVRLAFLHPESVAFYLRAVDQRESEEHHINC